MPAARRALVVLALALLAAAGCERRPEIRLPLHTSAGGPPNVLLVTVDTLRADHLGAYGYPLPTSTAIDGLAARGVRFTQAIATAPETAPAMASLLSGLYQSRSRVLVNRDTLPPHVQTLAEALRDAGYATAGLIGNLALAETFGFAQGFDRFRSFASIVPGRASDAMGVDAAIAWLAAGPATPWLLWIHLNDPQGPYVSADPSWSADLVYPPYMRGADEPLVLGDANLGLGALPRYQRIDGLTRPSEYVRRYDGEIRFTDAQIGRLLAALAAHGAAADTLVVLTADHGESLTEHRELFQHGRYLYDTTIRVPLILSWPGHLPEGRVADAQVSAVDLYPTLLEALGLGAQLRAMVFLDGRSFAAELFADRAQPDGQVAFALGARERRPFAARWQGWKLVHTPAGRPAAPRARQPAPPGPATPERLELYDLAADPGEAINVAPQHPELVGVLRARLDGFRAAFHSGGPPPR